MGNGLFHSQLTFLKGPGTSFREVKCFHVRSASGRQKGRRSAQKCDRQAKQRTPLKIEGTQKDLRSGSLGVAVCKDPVDHFPNAGLEIPIDSTSPRTPP